MGKVNELLKNYRMDDEVQKLIEEMGENAHELHISLKKRGHEPEHHTYMKTNGEWEKMIRSFINMYTQLKICWRILRIRMPIKILR